MAIKHLLKCPKCSSDLIISGSECYPESGMEIECTNVNCDFAGPTLIHHARTDKMLSALISAWRVLNGEDYGSV